MLDLKERTLDEEAAACLKAARRALERGFEQGAACARDLPLTLKALKELQHTIEQEEGVEAAVALGKHMQHLQLLHEPAGKQQGEGASGGGGSGGGKRVCIMLDGSLNSCSALRWAVEHLVDPEDDLHLLTIIPFHSIPFESDADKILQEAYDFAHNAAGVKPARLHPRSLMAGGGMGSTGGVGEAAALFMKQAAIDVVVLGSRGLGSIRRSLLGGIGMGSVSDYCVQHLLCPVLVVKQGPEAEKQQQT